MFPIQGSPFPYGDPHSEMGRQRKKIPFGESPFPKRVCNHLGINIYAYAHFWYICLQIAFAYTLFFFYFDASVFLLHCLWSIFLLFWCICFQIANAYRFHVRGLNIHMVSIHWDGIGYTIFPYYTQNILVKNFLIARHGHIFLPYLGMCVFCSSN